MKHTYYTDRPEEFRWVDLGEGVKIVGYHGDLAFLELPQELGGKPVIAVGSDAAYTLARDLKILIPHSVRVLEPESVSSFVRYFGSRSASWFSGFELAENHPWLKEENNLLLSADGTVLYISFDYHNPEIVVPEGVKVIGRQAFCLMQKVIQKVSFPDSLEIIEDNAFSGLSFGCQLAFPKGVRILGECLFDQLPGSWRSGSTVKVQIPETVESLGGGHHMVPSGLENNPHFMIQGSFLLSADGKKLVAFTADEDAQEVDIPEGVEEILPHSFKGYEKIKKITFPASLRFIRRDAFPKNKVKTLRIPAGLEDIEETGWDWSGLNSILVDKQNPHLYTDKTALYKRLPEDKLELMCCFRGKIEDYEIVPGTVSIRLKAFAHCEDLKSVTLPETMMNFMGSAVDTGIYVKGEKYLSIYQDYLRTATPDSEPCFLVEDGCIYQRTPEGLVLLWTFCRQDELAPREGTVSIVSVYGSFTTLRCPASLKRIEANAFDAFDTKLTSVQLNEGLEYIGARAFDHAKISTVSLPASLRYIAANAFDEGTESFEVAEGNQFYSSENGALYNKDKTILYRVPPKGKYNEFAVPATVKDIRRAFCGCYKINSIRLPDGIEVLADYAIAGCKKLKHLYIGAGLKYASTSFIDFDFPITIHAPAPDGLTELQEQLSRRADMKLKFDIAGLEDLSQLSKDFGLSRNPTGLTIARCLTQEKNVVVPATLGKYPVTKIGEEAFSNNHQMESLKLPDTVTEIGDNAFYSCGSLVYLELGSGLKTLGSRALYYCRKLESLNIPEGVEEIGSCAFFGCEKLSVMTFPASVKQICDDLFSDRDGSYRNLYLNPQCVYVVVPGSYAETFLRNYKTNKSFSRGDEPPLKVVYELPKTMVRTEADEGFLRYLAYAELEDGTLAVAFKNEQPEDVTDGVIPETLMGLPVSTLKGAIPVNIAKLSLPAALTRLDNVSIHSSYESETYLASVEVAENNPVFWSDGSAIYSKDRTRLARFLNAQVEGYAIVPGCQVIEPGAIAQLPLLKTLTLPESLSSIGLNAFTRTPLESIEGIERISDIDVSTVKYTPWFKNQQEIYLGSRLAKYGREDQKTYTVREGTTEIIDSAFERTIEWGQPNKDILEEIIIPDSVTRVGHSAFCTREKLKSVRLPVGLKKLEGNLFYANPSLETIHIPASVEEIAPDFMPAAKSTWNGVIPAALKSITVEAGSSFFKSVDGVLFTADGGTLVCFPSSHPATAYTVPEGVHTIAQNAFACNPTIASVILPESLKTIETDAFQRCAALGSVTMPALTTMGRQAFLNCSGLKNLTLPEGLETIGEKALAMTGIQKIVLPKSVKTVESCALAHCPDITVYDSIDPNIKPLSASRSWSDPKASIGRMVSRDRFMAGFNNCYITVRSAQTDEIKFIIPRFAQDNHYDYHSVLGNWGGHAEFDFAGLDEFFPNIKGVPNKIKAAVYRLRWPVNMTDKAKEAYTAYLSKAAKDLVKSCIDSKDMETLSFCAPFGVLKKNNIDELIEYATKAKAVEFSAYLMAYKNENFASKKSSAMPSLSIKAASPWTAPKTGTSKIGRYKGEDVVVEFPSEWKGKPLTGIADTTTKVPDNYGNIVEVIIPEGYTSIGNNAFFGCVKLEKVTLPSTLQTIGRDAFCNCRSLKEIIIPDSVTQIDQGAFYGCEALTKVVLSKSVTSILTGVFYGCDSLTEIELPASVRMLYKDSFSDCQSLTKVIYHGTELQGDGAPFWKTPEIHVNPGTTVKVYGIRKKDIHYMGDTKAASPTDVQYSEVDSIEFKGQIFVLSGFGADEEARISKIITDKGGEVKSSLVVKTNYLILNENYGGITSKYTKALEMNTKGKNIRILSAARFDELAK